MAGADGMAESDAELVEQTRSGDREAFGALVERYHRTIFALALQHGFQWTEAEDVAQEAFIRAYQGLPGLKTPAAFAGWLYSIATHTLQDAERSRRRRPPDRSLDDGIEPHFTPAFGLPPAAEEALQALRQLDPSQQLVVTLRYLEGLTPKQIAERLGEPRGTIRSRLHHALAYLHVALSGSAAADAPQARGEAEEERE